MLLVLTGVTAISVALLAYVNELTKEPIAQANAKTLSDAVSAVVPGFDNDPIAEKKMQEVNGVQYSVYPATKGGEYIGAAVEAVAVGFGGELKCWSVSMLERQNHRLLLVVACGNSGVGFQGCRLVQERQ